MASVGLAIAAAVDAAAHKNIDGAGGLDATKPWPEESQADADARTKQRVAAGGGLEHPGGEQRKRCGLCNLCVSKAEWDAHRFNTDVRCQTRRSADAIKRSEGFFE